MLYAGYRMERKRRNWVRLIGAILPIVFLLAHQLRQKQKRNAAPTLGKQHAYRPVVPQAGPTWVWWVFVAVIAAAVVALVPFIPSLPGRIALGVLALVVVLLLRILGHGDPAGQSASWRVLMSLESSGGTEAPSESPEEEPWTTTTHGST